MSPILTRPVREQFEHDRVIRVLHARYRRKFEVAMNPGAEQNASVMAGELTVFPDLLLFSQDRARKLVGTVEVETGESINTLEAMAEWAVFGRLRVPLHLYVPPNALDTVKRLCAEHQVEVAEIWTYHTAVDQVRFTIVHRAPDQPAPAKVRAQKAETPAPVRATKVAPVKAARVKAAPAKARAASSKAAAKAGKTIRATKKAVAKKAPSARPARGAKAKKAAPAKSARAAKRR